MLTEKEINDFKVNGAVLLKKKNRGVKSIPSN